MNEKKQCGLQWKQDKAFLAQRELLWLLPKITRLNKNNL